MQTFSIFPIFVASWFKGDVMEIIQTALVSGGEPNKSDALTINGQPGDLYNCSKQGTYVHKCMHASYKITSSSKLRTNLGKSLGIY